MPSILPSGSAVKVVASPGPVARRRRLLYAPVAALLVVATGCYWLRYADLMATHTDLLAQMAADASAAVTQGIAAGPPAQGTMRYPYVRAEHFAAVAARRFPQRASLARFRELLSAYEAVLTALEAPRPAAGIEESGLWTGGSVARSAALEALAGQVEAAAAAVHSQLGQERGGG